MTRMKLACMSSVMLFTTVAFADQPAGPKPVGKPGSATPAAAGPAVAAPAAAKAPAATAPTPAPELVAFGKGLEGSWKCDTKLPAGAMGPGSPEVTAKSKVTIKKDLGGFWYAGVYEVKKTKTTPGIKADFFVGYDPGSKQIIMTGIDNMGGAAFEVGPLQGESATATGDGYMMGMKVKERETMTVKGPKEVFHKFEVDMGKGFMSMGEDSCKK